MKVKEIIVERKELVLETPWISINLRNASDLTQAIFIGILLGMVLFGFYMVV